MRSVSRNRLQSHIYRLNPYDLVGARVKRCKRIVEARKSIDVQIMLMSSDLVEKLNLVRGSLVPAEVTPRLAAAEALWMVEH